MFLESAELRSGGNHCGCSFRTIRPIEHHAVEPVSFLPGEINSWNAIKKVAKLTRNGVVPVSNGLFSESRTSSLWNHANDSCFQTI